MFSVGIVIKAFSFLLSSAYFDFFRASHQRLIEVKVKAQNPEYEYDVILIDGMDQNKTGS